MPAATTALRGITQLGRPSGTLGTVIGLVNDHPQAIISYAAAEDHLEATNHWPLQYPAAAALRRTAPAQKVSAAHNI